MSVNSVCSCGKYPIRVHPCASVAPFYDGQMMIDAIRNMAGLAGIMKDLPKIKARMAEVNEKLGSMTVEAETGGGAVRVRASGLLRIVAVEIDPALMAGLVDPHNADDRAMAQDLIAGAVNAAMTKAREMAEQQFAQAASDLGLPIPPGGLGGMLGQM